MSAEGEIAVTKFPLVKIIPGKQQEANTTTAFDVCGIGSMQEILLPGTSSERLDVFLWSSLFPFVNTGETHN